jgi:hypothetical protein
MNIYSVAGELVWNTTSLSGGYIYWDGRNNNHVPVSAGTYYYVVQNGGSILLTGKVLLLTNK